MQLVVLLSPFITKDRFARYEGIMYVLASDFDDLEGTELWYRLLESIPYNIISFYEKDLSSARIAPLLSRYIDTSDNNIGKFIIACCFIRQKPKNWLDVVKKYAFSLNKNAFFLLKLLSEASREYKYGFCSTKQKQDMAELITLITTRHELGVKKPSVSIVKKYSKRVIDALSGDNR